MKLAQPMLHLRRDFYLKIRYKLLIAYSCLFALALICGSEVIFFLMRDVFEEKIEHELHLTTDSMLSVIETSVKASIRSQLRAAAEMNRDVVAGFHNRSRQGEFSREEAMAQVRAIMLDQKIGKTGYMYCIDSEGIVRLHPERELEGGDLSGRGPVDEQKRMKEGYVEYSWRNPGEENARAKALYMTYFEPWDWIISASSYQSEFHDMIDMDDLGNTILSFTFGETGYAYVMDSRGNLIIHPQLEGSVYDATDANGRPFIRDICAQKSGSIVCSWKDPDDDEYRERLVIFDYIPAMDWIVAATSYTEEIYRPLQEIRRIFSMAVLVTLVVVVLCTLLISSSLIRPLHKLISKAERVAGGDLSVGEDESLSDELGVGDEISDLAQAFREMQEGLRSLAASAKMIAAGDLSQSVEAGGDLGDAYNQMLTNLRRMVRQIREAGVQIETASARMAASTSEQTSSATQQSASIGEVTSTMVELARSSKEVTDSSEQVAEIASQNQEDARSGVEAAEATLAAMDAIRESHEISTKGIASLSGKVQQISEIMDIIGDIADQTKLIAFNATIEAVGAGEGGRRFGVVAQEIRRLSDTVMEATEDSRLRIVEIQESASNMVVISERNARTCEEGLTTTRVTADSLQKIMDSANNTAGSAQRISLSTQQERTALEQVLEAMMEVHEGAARFVSKVREGETVSADLRQLATELTELIGSYQVGGPVREST